MHTKCIPWYMQCLLLQKYETTCWHKSGHWLHTSTLCTLLQKYETICWHNSGHWLHTSASIVSDLRPTLTPTLTKIVAIIIFDNDNISDNHFLVMTTSGSKYLNVLPPFKKWAFLKKGDTLALISGLHLDLAILRIAEVSQHNICTSKKSMVKSKKYILVQNRVSW